jgi:hypothetical protein
MTQAARSGRQNIIEGSERSATSKDTEMKLTDVGRASLSELRGDCEILIIDRDQLPWSVHSSEAKAVNAITLDKPPFTDDLVHESAKHALEQRKKYARWLDADDAVVVANAVLIISRAPRSPREKPPALTGLPALRQGHAPAQVRQRRVLEQRGVSQLQRNQAGVMEVL